jgi:hypothetical protein
MARQGGIGVCGKMRNKLNIEKGLVCVGNLIYLSFG